MDVPKIGERRGREAVEVAGIAIKGAVTVVVEDYGGGACRVVGYDS